MGLQWVGHDWMTFTLDRGRLLGKLWQIMPNASSFSYNCLTQETIDSSTNRKVEEYLIGERHKEGENRDEFCSHANKSSTNNMHSSNWIFLLKTCISSYTENVGKIKTTFQSKTSFLVKKLKEHKVNVISGIIYWTMWMVESIVHRTKEICWVKLRMVTFILQLFYKNRIRTVEWREVTESKKRDLTREMVHTLLISITERMRRTQKIKRSVCLTRYTSRKFERQSNPKTFMNTIRECIHSFWS